MPMAASAARIVWAGMRGPIRRNAHVGVKRTHSDIAINHQGSSLFRTVGIHKFCRNLYYNSISILRSILPDFLWSLCVCWLSLERDLRPYLDSVSPYGAS